MSNENEITIEIPPNVIERIADHHDMIKRVRVQKLDPKVGRSWAFTHYMQSYKAMGKPDKSPEEIAAAAVSFIVADHAKNGNDDDVEYRVHLECQDQRGKKFHRYAEFKLRKDDDEGFAIDEGRGMGRGLGLGGGRRGFDGGDGEADEEGTESFVVQLLARTLQSQERQLREMHRIAVDREKSFSDNFDRLARSVSELVRSVPDAMNKAIVLMEKSHEKSETMLEINMLERLEMAKLQDGRDRFKETVQALSPMAQAMVPAIMARIMGVQPTQAPKPTATQAQAQPQAQPSNVVTVRTHEDEDDMPDDASDEAIDNAEDEDDGLPKRYGDPSVPIETRILQKMDELSEAKIRACEKYLGPDVIASLRDESTAVAAIQQLGLQLHGDPELTRKLDAELGDDGVDLVNLVMESFGQ